MGSEDTVRMRVGRPPARARGADLLWPSLESLADLAEAPFGPALGHGPYGPAAGAWRRYRENRAALIGLVILLALAAAAVLAPFLHTTDPLATDYGAIDQGPSWQHWLGTDGVGSDLLSRLLYGLRVPLFVSAVGTAITVSLGTLIGVTAGYRGGLTDALLSRSTDLVFAFPGFLLALIVAGLVGHSLDSSLGGAGRVLLVTGVLSLVSWPALMRLVRSLTLVLSEQPFLDAARAFGCSDVAIITRHLLPNLWGLILVKASFIAVNMIGVESALSLFGVGVQSPNPDLGVMLFDGKDKMALNTWELLVPGVALSLIILAGTFIGSGLRDAFDPRQ